MKIENVVIKDSKKKIFNSKKDFRDYIVLRVKVTWTIKKIDSCINTI